MINLLFAFSFFAYYNLNRNEEKDTSKVRVDSEREVVGENFLKQILFTTLELNFQKKFRLPGVMG